MWQKLISEFIDVQLRDPATEGQLAEIETRLGQRLPGDLRQLLLESDGVDDEYGSEIVWCANRIIRDNLSFRVDESYRDLYMSFDALMFFGDNGGGDYFAFVRSPEREDVFVWDHETDSRNWVSPGLERFLRKTLESAGGDWYR